MHATQLSVPPQGPGPAAWSLCPPAPFARPFPRPFRRPCPLPPSLPPHLEPPLAHGGAAPVEQPVQAERGVGVLGGRERGWGEGRGKRGCRVKNGNRATAGVARLLGWRAAGWRNRVKIGTRAAPAESTAAAASCCLSPPPPRSPLVPCRDATSPWGLQPCTTTRRFHTRTPMYTHTHTSLYTHTASPTWRLGSTLSARCAVASSRMYDPALNRLRL